MWTYFKVESSPNAWSYVPYLGIIAGGTNEDITKVYFFFDSTGRLIRTQANKKSDSENSWVGIGRIASQGNRDERAAHVAAEMRKIDKPFDEKTAHKVKFIKDD
jgi:rRNA pseudouridine-1189 N-methylase Emg1 (Nep1/Mra1 family)